MRQLYALSDHAMERMSCVTTVTVRVTIVTQAHAQCHSSGDVIVKSTGKETNLCPMFRNCRRTVEAIVWTDNVLLD